MYAEGGEGRDDMGITWIRQADGIVPRAFGEADKDGVALAGEHLNDVDHLGFNKLAVYW